MYFIIDVKKEEGKRTQVKDKWELTSCDVSVKRARSCDRVVDEREVLRGSGHRAEALC